MRPRWTRSGNGLVGGRSTAACAGLFGLLPLKTSSRFTFCPAAIIRVSELVFSSALVRKRRIPCQSLPSANKGSIYTLRLRTGFRALLRELRPYGVFYYPGTGGPGGPTTSVP
jgi:hypothetical protein